jgi:DNA-binding GntR family transcriptional regulator
MNITPSIAAQAIEMGQSVAGRITTVLAERIVSGVLAPGSRLMQDHVAEEFQASHVPVREAFRKLEAQGLLISKPRCGVRVSQLDPDMVIEVTEMRAVLEGLALHHALPRLGRADLDAAHQALVEGEASDQIAVWEAANRRFHLAITAPCGMSRLMASIGDLHRSDARFLFATWKQLDWQPRSDTELGDVMMMHVYLAADPAKDGKMDFAGMMAGYTQFFGTKDQPNKPARTTVQVVLPAGARGALIEIDLIAVRP